jgi:hypothetical protein
MKNSVTFFNSFIGQKLSGIPYSTQWLFSIDSIPATIAQNDLQDIDTQTWAIRATSDIVRDQIKNTERTIEGNIFAQAVTLPKEEIGINYVGADEAYRGGFLPVPVSTSRRNMEPLDVQFLETRNSFTDLIVRPWIIKVGHQGLLPQKDPANNIKSTITIRFFDRGDATKPDQLPAVRKQFTFYNAAPVFCDTDTNDYQKNQITVLKTRWVYSHYTVESVSTG